MSNLLLVFVILMASCGDKIIQHNYGDSRDRIFYKEDPNENPDNQAPDSHSDVPVDYAYPMREFANLPHILHTRLYAPSEVQGLSSPYSNRILELGDKRYQHITVLYNDKKKKFNHVELEKGTRVIKVVAIDLKLHVGGDIYETLNGTSNENKELNDIEKLEIHVDTLTVSDPLYLPSTQLTIYANKIIFEERGQFILTPASYPKELEEGPHRIHREDGQEGLDAPNVYAYANEIVDLHKNTKRFILRGGKGQKAGPGINGRHGKNLPVATTFKDGDIIYTCTYTTTEYAYDSDRGGFNYDSSSCTGINAKPNNGEDAMAAGLPGKPGKSGNFFTNNNQLMELIDVEAGDIGERGSVAKGGLAGKPKKVVFREINYTVWVDHGEARDGGKSVDDKIYIAYDGKDALAPELTIDEKEFKGQVTLERVFAFDDVINDANSQKIRYLEDIYGRNYYGPTYHLALHLEKYFEDALNEDDDSKLGFANDSKNYLKVKEIIAKIHANKDFYGEDAFSIPFLSINNAINVYKKQIENHLKTLYFVNLIQTKNSNLILRQELIDNKKAELTREIEVQLKENERTFSMFKDINYDALIVERDAIGFVEYLQRLESEIQAEAQEEVNRRERERRGKYRFKTILKTLASVAKVIPVGQPALATAIGSAEALVEGFSSDSWVERIGNVAESYDKFTDINFKGMGAEWNEKWEPFRMSNISDLSFKEKAKKIGELGKMVSPVARAMSDGLGKLKEYRAPLGELEAIIADIKKHHPEFNEATQRLSELNRKKMALDAKINDTFIKLSSLQSDILENTSILSGLNHNGEDLLAALPPETNEIINIMASRAERSLFKYLHYFSRVYYFRTLEQFPMDIDLRTVKDKIERILKASDGNSYLTTENLENLKTLLLEPIRTLLDSLMSGDFIDEQKAKRIIRLKDEKLKLLSKGQKLYFNLKDMNIFMGEHQKNPRIKNIKVLKVMREFLTSGHNLVGELYIKQIGHSIFYKNRIPYLFTHLNSNGGNPFYWGTNLDFTNPNNEFAIERNNSFESLLSNILGEGENLKEQFIFPSATTDFEISLHLSNPDLDNNVEIKEIELEVEYIFSR